MGVRPLLVLLLFASACLSPPPRVPVRESPKAPSPAESFLQGEPVLEKVGDFDQPLYLTAPRDDPRLFVVEKTGRVKVLPANEVFLDLSKEVSTGSEQGLFSIAFAPDYAASGLAYVDYTDLKGDTRVVEFKVDVGNANRLERASRREILFVKQPFANHNGGLVLFDPSGMLIVGLGDGGSGNDPGNRAQNTKELLGKLLRIDLRRPGSVQPEVLAYGLRNPWRFSYDAEGALWVADVGQNAQEEVNRVPPPLLPGANFGWRKYEGNKALTDDKIDESKLIRPVFTYPTSSGCAVTGGYVYRGRVASLRGRYLFADFCRGVVESLAIDGTDHKVHPQLKTENLASFGEDSKGDLYITSLNGGVFRITAAR